MRLLLRHHFRRVAGANFGGRVYVRFGMVDGNRRLAESRRNKFELTVVGHDVPPRHKPRERWSPSAS